MSVLLVRVECLCGTVAAIPEGGQFPLCGKCGRRMVCPLRLDGDGQWTGNQVLAYAAEIGEEQDIVRRVRSSYSEEKEQDRSPWYGRGLLREALVERGWPTERPPWPEIPCGGGNTYTPPPWETAAP